MLKTFKNLTDKQISDFKNHHTCIEVVQCYSTLTVKLLDEYESLDAVKETFEEYLRRRAIFKYDELPEIKKHKVCGEYYEELMSYNQNLSRHLLFVDSNNSWGEVAVMGDNIIVNANLHEW